ncbi:hypothetical protein [Sulfurovum sp.]|uniref:hypothetical protein n=1 Tax=Sulfurovum sp. TaxID=1969726 RepID=UPI0025D0FE2C|nr:hypothetical protein [Sulfurovum sp.]
MNLNKIWKKWNVLVVFVVMTVVGMVVYGCSEPSWSAWGVWGALDTSSAVALGVMAFMAYLDYAKNEDEISIIFDANGKRVDTQLSILRKHFTRSEVLGILGMKQKDPKRRFDLQCMKKKSFLAELHSIQRGKGKEFILEVSTDELEQFHI